ncbi:MAG: hypothetical protein RBR71_09940 [Gudongella sp.]|nr:hypothetical protein [Gudongella sp.]
MGFLLLFIVIVLILVFFSWAQKNNKGRYVKRGAIIALFIVSFTMINRYNYHEAKTVINQALHRNYNEFTNELLMENPGTDASNTEQNEYFKRQIYSILSPIRNLDTISEIPTMKPIFTSDVMEDTFSELVETLFSIKDRMEEEDYSLDPTMVRNLSKSLSEIGFILRVTTGDMKPNIWGTKEFSVTYDENEIDLVDALIKEINIVLNSEKTVEYPNIHIAVTSVECDYIEPISGKVRTFEFPVKDGMLEDVLNDWIRELSKMRISYGNTSSGENILEKLLIVDAYLEGVDIVIVMNDAFIAFESSDFNNYTNPGYFMFGLKDIVSQVTDAESMTIDYNGKTSEVIHPEGYVIDNIPLRD